MGCGEGAQPALNSPWVLSPLTQQTHYIIVHLGWGCASPGPGSGAQRARGTGPALQKARLQDVKI